MTDRPLPGPGRLYAAGAILARTLRGHAPVADHVRAERWRSGYLGPVLLTNTAAARPRYAQASQVRVAMVRASSAR